MLEVLSLIGQFLMQLRHLPALFFYIPALR